MLEHETGHYLIGCLCALEFKYKYLYYIIVELINLNILKITGWNVLNYFKTHFNFIFRWRNSMMKKQIIVKMYQSKRNGMNS